MRFPISALIVTLSFAAAAPAAQPEQPAPATAVDRELAGRVERLVRQLNDDRAATRDAAEEQLLEMAGTTTVQSDRILKLMPEPKDEMPLAVRDRLTRIRQQIEDRAAKSAVAGTTVTLSAEKRPLSVVFNLIDSQTGNRLRDKRDQFGGAGGGDAVSVALGFENEPFWPAVDKILDEAKLSVYNYGGEDGLAIVPRGPDDGPRFGAAAYSGPFRMEILEVQGQRNARQPNRKALKLQLEVAWEPRLRPIALSQPAADIAATDDSGKPILISQPEAVLDVEVPAGTQAAEIILPFELPPRDVKRIATLRGKLKALVPGRQVQFKFTDLVNSANKTQRSGGVQVTLEAVRRNNAVWEVHMRFALDEANRALESHRGWVFQNVSYLVGADGQRIEQAGMETTRQTPNEVGVAYVFDLPEGKRIEELTWIYETPAAIVVLPVEYEIKDIDLP
ncbi:MAG: hypothetical protein WD669_04005 [Pirellulales bacterium]